MESQLEKISAVECRVHVQIPWETVSPRLTAKVRDLQRKARIPGFRPGKVPPQMIERLFGKGLRDELARELVEETFQSAVVSHQKVPLTQPALESEDLTPGQPFTYAARFEVPPEITPVDYLGVAVRRRPAVADEAKVEARLKAKQEELHELRPIEGRTETRPGDVWTVDIEGSIGDTRVSRKDAKIEIGNDSTDLVPGLGAQLAALSLEVVGQSRQLRFQPVQERLRTDLRGKDAVLTLGFREVKEKHLPALDDDFAKDTGEAETIADLRDKYAAAVRAEDLEEAERDARQRLVNTLLERNDFEVAPSLIAREVDAQVDLFRRQLAQQGVDLRRMGLNEAALAQNFRPQATFNVKAFLLLDAIGKVEGITVSSEELDAEVQKLAEERGQNAARLRATMEKNNELLLLTAQLREEKILDLLMSKAEVTEAPDPEPEPEPAAEASDAEAAT